MTKRSIVRADRSDDRDTRKSFVTEGLESGICTFILRKEDSDFESLGKIEAIYFENGVPCGDDIEVMDITDPESQKKALSLSGKKDLIVSTGDWTIIPLENLIASSSNGGKKILACARSLDEAKLFLTTMEKGVDGIVIDVDDPHSISKFKDILAMTSSEELSEVTVTSVRPISMGDRVCIDTCSMMSPGEGMLIGSYSNCLFLVQSESEENGYVASRPFRVNAGAVHSYIEVPGGGTRYLSELSGGDEILICDGKGKTKSAAIGRCKVEKRPLLMITASDGESEYSVMLQNAETVKVVSVSGSISVSKLSPGDRILAKLSKGGRHFGMAIEETISEK